MVFALGSSVGDDVKWKSAIERALGTWESVVEWADYISFLSRVQKAIKNKHRCEGSKLPLAPQISEMLARCLEPSLPAGVHQTCIDVYDTIFTIVGSQKLSETVNVWLPGLLPAISWAAFNVKPLVVRLFSKHIIPAVSSNPEELRELYRPILMSLLQSIEDESSDCYAEISELIVQLKTLSEKNADSLFWQCFYLCILTSPDSRLGALTFLQKNKPDTTEASLFIRSVCSGLEDKNVLVQRGFLDILSKFLPLDSQELQTNEEDLHILILSACKTIFRKDMSLNRRLRLWLLGPEIEAGENESEGLSHLEYLKKYAANALTNVLLSELRHDITRTCTIAQGLMDRWEVGVTIAPALLTPVLHDACERQVVNQSVASFFDNIESSIVWNTVIRLLDSHPETVLFMVCNFNIQDNEMLNLYIPHTILYLLADTELTELKSSIVQHLLSVLPNQDIPEIPADKMDNENLREYIANVFNKNMEANITGLDEDSQLLSGLPRKHVSWYLLKLAGDVVLNTGSAVVLNKVLGLFPDTPGLEVDIPQCSELISCLSAESSDGVEMFIHIAGRMSPEQICHYVQQFVQSLAKSLTTNGSRQLEKVKELWQINEATDGLVVPSAVSAVLADKSILLFNRAKIFSGIWAHSIDKTDVGVMLTKPLLLFMDLETEDKSLFYAYLQSSVVRTGTAPRMVKLLVDKLDVESRGDDYVFSYVLEKFVTVLANPEILSAYISKYASLVCTFLLEWFDKALLSEKAYTHALELAELTILDPRIRDGKVWLRRFVDAQTHTYIKEFISQQSVDPEKRQMDTVTQDLNSAVNSGSASIGHASVPIPVALVKFVVAAIPNLDNKGDIRLFIEICVSRLRSEVDYEIFNQLLNSLLLSDPDVEESLLQSIVAKLNRLDKPLMQSESEDIDDSRGVLHLIAAMESIISTGLEVLRLSASNSNHSGGITSAITGFQVESPEDRTKAEASQVKFLKCLQVAVAESCKYWMFLQRTKISGNQASSGEYATALHTTGRLKTRLRKLMSLCYSARPMETLQAVGENISDTKVAVRMTHMFEGARTGPTLELLLSMAMNDMHMFKFAADYVDSLETDVIGDVWPILQQFLTTAASNVSSSSSSTAGSLLASVSINGNSSKNYDEKRHKSGSPQPVQSSYGILAFLTQIILPRFDQLKLKNHKKVMREFGDIYAKLILAETGDLQIVGDALQKMSVIITEPDRQASLLGRVLNTLLKSPHDIGEKADLLNKVSSTFNIAGTSPAKVWTRHIGDFMFETRTEKDLIPMNLQQSIKMKPVIKTWVQCDRERVKEFISKLPTYGSSTGVLFGWSGTQELANSNLRRLAYLMVCTPSTILGVNWSKLANQLATMWEQNAAAVCLLLRACLLAEPSTTIMSFMAYYLQSVFRSVLGRKTQVSGKDAELLVEACKLIDMALVIGTEQFQPFEWLFISDNGNTVYNYIGQTSGDKRDGTSSEKRRVHGRAGGILERLVGCPAIPRVDVPEQIMVPTPSYKSKRRPLLPQRAALEDLPAFLSQVSVASNEEVYSMTIPDREYCEMWLLADLFQ